MKRRDVLKSTALVLGYAMVGGSAVAVINGCKADTSPMWKPSFLAPTEDSLLREVTERIIPTTDTPGAREAFVDRYIDEAVYNNFTSEEQEHFRMVLGKFDEWSQSEHDKLFIELTTEQMDGILQMMSDDADKNRAEMDKPHPFDLIKQLTISGYFTSEIGTTQALVFDPIPGPYKGCIDVSEVGGTYAL